MPAEWASRPVLVRWQLERPMYDFKNSFSPAFINIHRAKYIFSTDMFCLPHFWAKIHGVGGNALFCRMSQVQLHFRRNFSYLLMNSRCCYFHSVFRDVGTYTYARPSPDKVFIKVIYNRHRQGQLDLYQDVAMVWTKFKMFLRHWLYH